MSILVNPNYSAVNCLNLESPEAYTGQIWQYHVSHLELTLNSPFFMNLIIPKFSFIWFKSDILICPHRGKGQT
jgi:hypothetical protein